VRLELKPFTLVGATTQAGKISSPLRDRFGVVQRMEFYKDKELAEIVIQAAEKMAVDINKKAALDLASRSRKTARIALKLLKRVRDFAEVYSHSVIDEAVIKKALNMLEVDEHGLDANDRMVLKVMIEKHGGGPVGLSTLSASVAEDIATIEDVYEPFLMRAGFLKRTSQGRVVTKKAYELFGKSPKNKKSDQESLL
jgi:Holliday junction DNA helicase RuvB